MPALKRPTRHSVPTWKIVHLHVTLGYICIDQFGGFLKQAFFGVFDGHGGKNVAEYCADRMHKLLLKLLKESAWKSPGQCLEETFLQVDEETRVLRAESVGSTVCVALVMIENKERILYIANVGDTRAVLIKTEGCQRLSYEHKATDQNEIVRLQKVGGYVMTGRVGGELAVTRSIGDHSLRESGVIPNPAVRKHIVKPTDRWVVVATDGVWDCLTDKDVEELVKEKDEPAKRIAQKIVKLSLIHISEPTRPY
eukprot:TRINITY_DN8566_c0_g1_i3.p1 TRINITY_DN8566_c0_g1~~TRINITY_DN8566_c0_g1_i3.p1  ORF type:complete len:253 (+),score=52.46 TRINITY_DN8566_c0_g1_i3:203-961(+)